MSGEGLIASRPAGAPNEHSRLGERPGVITRLVDGQHHVCLIVPDAGWGRVLHLLSPDEAERLGRELLEYAALVRDKIGLSPCERRS